MINDDNTKNDLVVDTISGQTLNLSLIGDRVVILLDKATDHTTTESGILIPLSELSETDGGRLTTRTSSQQYLMSGTVVGMSKFSSLKFEEQHTSITNGDRVYLSKSAVSPAYQFFPERSNLVIDFTGYICVPHTLIEAKIN